MTRAVLFLILWPALLVGSRAAVGRVLPPPCPPNDGACVAVTCSPKTARGWI